MPATQEFSQSTGATGLLVFLRQLGITAARAAGRCAVWSRDADALAALSADAALFAELQPMDRARHAAVHGALDRVVRTARYLEAAAAQRDLADDAHALDALAEQAQGCLQLLVAIGAPKR